MSCPDCFKGHIHEGAPQGKMTKLHGLNTYVSQPAEGKPVKGIVIIIPDAFGVEFVNNKLLADHLVEKGDYKVYLPDFMNGKLHTFLSALTYSAVGQNMFAITHGIAVTHCDVSPRFSNRPDPGNNSLNLR